MPHNTFNTLQNFKIGNKSCQFYSLPALGKALGVNVQRLPVSIRVVLESVLRNCDGQKVTEEHIRQLAGWQANAKREDEIPFVVARVVLQDFTGVPLLADIAAMRSVADRMGKDPKRIEPLVPVDLVVDHSVMIDYFGTKNALDLNMKLEFKRNHERYQFMKWGMQAFDTFGVVPPGFGIVHQVNLEYLARGVHKRDKVYYPDSLVGTDSHTTMINGIGVVGWGVGGIEAEAAMLGQPVYILTPDVVGVELKGRLREGVTATDLVLTITEMLRREKVVGKFVEFCGPGTASLTVSERATIGNMAPEYGATCGFFPVDGETIKYLTMSNRSAEQIALVEAYTKAQGLWREEEMQDPVFTEILELDLGTVVPSMAGPKRPEGRIALEDIASNFEKALEAEYKKTVDTAKRYAVEGEDFDLGHGDVVIAAITSCTNTSNPSVLLAAGLLARNANRRGLKRKPWVKSSLAPGSKVVAEYYEKSGLQKELDQLGFNLVGFGCTTCIGNSGPLPEPISKTINDKGLIGAAVLSGNRNFEGRVSPDVQANYLASPPLVVAYALAGTVRKDLTKEPLGEDESGNPVYLRDIWPTSAEVQEFIAKHVTRELFATKYADVFNGDEYWRGLEAPAGQTYAWDQNSTYVQNPPYFEGMQPKPRPGGDIKGARVLGLFGDKITTDHISPAGSIKAQSPAGQYLLEHGVGVADFNQYGTRRGNHEVMMRGTFANIRIRNHMLGENGREGGYTIHYPSKEEMPIYDAAMRYRQEGVPLVIFAGVEYGNGSSRDWAAKGTNLLGVRAVIAQSFERIHRSNLVGMGVIPFVFAEETSWKELGLKGDEIVTIEGLDNIKPRATMVAKISYADGSVKEVPLLCRIDTLDELEYFKNGGILQYVLRDLAA